MKKWLHELRDFGSSDMVVVLVGNKSDISHLREVDEDDGKNLAETEALYFMETSALENLNVEEAFMQMITRIHEIASQKSLEAKKNETTISTIKALPVGKEVINIDDEVSATKQASYCCSY